MVVNLANGWRMETDVVDRDGENFEQGFVFAPNGDSASLAYALACGATSGDKETAIPSDVMQALRKYEQYE